MYIYTKLYTCFLVIIKSCFGFITTTANTFIILLYTVSNTAEKFRKMSFFIYRNQANQTTAITRASPQNYHWMRIGKLFEERMKGKP